MSRDYKTSQYKKTIGITENQLDWLKKHKGKKSAAGFLETIIKAYQDELSKLQS